MRLARPLTIFTAMALLAMPHAVLAQSKESRKKPDSTEGYAQNCKPVVQSMTESATARKRDCPPPRRILM